MTSLSLSRLSPDTDPARRPPAVEALAADLLDALRRDGMLGTHGLTALERIFAYAQGMEDRLAMAGARIAELETAAVTDPLTGLLNRRGFEGALSHALAHADRHGDQGLIALLDLDAFKPVNDRYGHAAGDAVLRRTAEIIQREIRQTDAAARLGGDEFAILLVKSELAGGLAHLEKIRRTLDAAHVPFAGALLPMHASMGVVGYGRHMAAADLLVRADRAMYLDKRRRRVKERAARRA